MKTVVDAVNELRADAASGEYTAKVNYFGHLGFDEVGDWVACERNYSLMVCSIKEFNQCVAEMSEAKWIPESKPIFTQAMADAGELPPVGSEFMYSRGGDFQRGAMLFNDGVTLLICLAKNRRNRWHWKAGDPDLEFKPIKSDREKAIDEMKDDIREFKDQYVHLDNYDAGKLYDANYRKLTPSQAKAYDDKTGYFGEDYK